jgi:2-iminobutanoate/2-iminopropanoate deaminase
MKPERKVVTAKNVPQAIGPYSLAITVGQMIYTAGQTGVDPSTNSLVNGGIEAETRQTLVNIRNVLEAAGSSLQNIVKTTVFLRDMGDFTAMNAVYASFFPSEPPARSTVQVAALPKGAAIEIETIAILNS